MNSHSTEQLLFSFALLLTVVVYTPLQNASSSAKQKSKKVLTGFLGVLMPMV